MVQIVEYSLILLSSALFVSFSLFQYGNFVQEARVQAASNELERFKDSVITASILGSSSIAPGLMSETLSCSNGRISISSLGVNVSQQLSLGCNFNVALKQGNTVLFYEEDGKIVARVIS